MYHALKMSSATVLSKKKSIIKSLRVFTVFLTIEKRRSPLHLWWGNFKLFLIFILRKASTTFNYRRHPILYLSSPCLLVNHEAPLIWGFSDVLFEQITKNEGFFFFELWQGNFWDNGKHWAGKIKLLNIFLCQKN